MKKVTLVVAAAAAIACMPPLASAAATAAMANPAYLVDGAGLVVHNASGECWRTGEWTPALATAPCDPSMAMPVPVAQVTQPAPPPPAPAPAPMTKPPVAVVVVPVPQKISFSGDALFARCAPVSCAQPNDFNAAPRQPPVPRFPCAQSSSAPNRWPGEVSSQRFCHQ